MAKRIEGYIHCTTKGCPQYGAKAYLYTRAEVDACFPPKGRIPICKACGKGMALWDRQTQETFDRVFWIKG